MDDSKENTPPIFILLPICFEAKTDLFLNVLRKVVSRVRTQNSSLENAFISGMTGKKFQVNLDDLSVDWTTLTSDSEQNWQSKLLGCWAARHFPSIGNKLIGAAWQPPKTWNVEVIGSTEMTEEEIDTIIFKKIKLRIIEMNVSISTQVEKLKNFVRAPATIGKFNVTNIPKSSTMRAFDIESEFLVDCWKALKVGDFPNYKQQINSISTLKPPQPSIVASHLAIEGHRINRQDGAVVSLDEAPIEKSNTTRSSNAMTSPSSPKCKNVPPCNVVLTNFIQRIPKINVASEPTINPTAKRARLDVTPNGDSNFDTLQVEVFEMRKDIQNLTKWLDFNAADDNEATNGPERLHLAVFKQKDAEISKLRASLQSVREDNELLKAVKTQLHSESEAKSDLIRVLEKGVEANSKLFEKSQEESNVLAQKLTAADQIIIQLTDTNRNLQVEINAAKSQFSNMESSPQIQILNDTIRKLQEDLNAAKSQSASIELNFQSQIQNLAKQLYEADANKIESTDTIQKLSEELSAAKSRSATIDSNFQSQIQNLAKQLYEADANKIESTDTIQKLSEELSAAKSRSATIDSNFQSQIQNLAKQLYEADANKIESTDTIQKLSEELSAAKSRSATIDSNFQSQIQNLAKQLYEADANKIESTDTIQKLSEELSAAKSRSASIDSNFQSQIQNLTKQLSEADDKKIETTDTIRKLREELDSAKIKLKENDKLEKTLNDTKLRFNDLLCELQVQMENSEKATVEAEKVNAGKNEKLQGELDALKQYAAIKDREISSLKSTLENRHESNVHIDLMNVPDISDGNNEVEAKKENMSNAEQETSVQEVLEPAEREIPEPLLEPDLMDIRRILLNCRFGWIKFYEKKNLRCPGFVHPTDEDGFTRAQKVKMDGGVSIKKKFYDFSENIPDSDKDKSQVKALNKLNQRFNFHFT